MVVLANPRLQRTAVEGESALIAGTNGLFLRKLTESPISDLSLFFAFRKDGFLVVRSTFDPHDLLPDVRAAVLSALPNIELRNIATMDELIAGQTAQRRLNMLMLGLFGLLGLTISTVGIYGVMAYVVSQRTREIGVRIALGAKRSQVVGMVLRNAFTLVVIGLMIGCAVSWSLAVNANKFLFGLEGHDARAFIAAVVSLSLAALLANLIPARRAASVDPAVTLRSE
jgi:putative ABC transport system permease protein